MRIQHNISALNASNKLKINDNAIQKNIAKLSSGYRINSAADDAAGLAVSEKMRAQIGGLNQAQDNTKNGISLIQTAEGGLNETSAILQRMNVLATESATGTYQDGTDRANLQKEVEALKSEVNRISTSTNFNQISLLDGTLGTGTIGVNASSSLKNGVALSTAKAVVTGISGMQEGTYTLTSGTVTDGVFAAGTGNIIQVALQKKDANGAVETTNTYVDLSKLTYNTKAGDSNTVHLGDLTVTTVNTDAAGFTAANLAADLTGKDVIGDPSGAPASGSALTFQVGADNKADQQVSLSIKDMSSTGLGIASLDIANQQNARNSIDTIKTAINTVNATRADLGALQNELEHTANNLSVMSENLTSAESTIRDVDMSSEYVQYSKNQILSQAANAMLAQANAQPQSVLSLIKG